MRTLCVSFALLISCFASSCVYAQGNLMDMLDMSEKLDRADKQELRSFLSRADDCTANRNFSCSESNIERAAKLAKDNADKKLLESSRLKITTEKQLIAREAKEAEEHMRLAEESRRRREDEEDRQLAQSNYNNSSGNSASWNNYFQQQLRNNQNVLSQLNNQQRQVEDLKRQEYQRQLAQEQSRRERAQQEERERQRQQQMQREARDRAEQAEREKQRQQQAQKEARDRAEQAERERIRQQQAEKQTGENSLNRPIVVASANTKAAGESTHQAPAASQENVLKTDNRVLSCVMQHDGRGGLTDRIWGKHCGDPKSVTVPVTNTCDYAINVQVCTQRINGVWDCGRNSRLNSHQTENFWTCGSTGYVRWTACSADDKRSCSVD